MHLYLAHVGFYDDEIGIYELHSNILVVAENVKSAKEKIKQKSIYQKKKMHIDGIIEIINVDGYEIMPQKNQENFENKRFSHDEVKMIG